jgi:hypothetical protein
MTEKRKRMSRRSHGWSQGIWKNRRKTVMLGREESRERLCVSNYSKFSLWNKWGTFEAAFTKWFTREIREVQRPIKRAKSSILSQVWFCIEASFSGHKDHHNGDVCQTMLTLDNS